MCTLVTPPAALQVGKDCNLLSWGPSREKKKSDYSEALCCQIVYLNIKDPHSPLTPFLKEHISNTDAKLKNPSHL